MNISHDTLHIIISIVCVILIIYAGTVPWQVSEFFDSIFGRILALFIIIVVSQKFGFFNGILITLTLLLIISNSPRLGASSIRGQPRQTEGFSTDLQKRKALGPKWFVEKVLGENPVKIITEKTQTDAVQDLSERSMH